jgi:heme-degrading monooxygenase HmoA
MIVRLWKGRASAANADAYERHVTTAVFPKLGELGGYLRGRVFRRTLDRQVEFLVITEWESAQAIRAFAGDDPNRAVVESAARAVLSDFDAHVDHYELLHDSQASR